MVGLMKIIRDNKEIYFCSDPHYHHGSLVRGTSNWEDKSPCRNFDTLEEHNNALVNNINNIVGVNDILFILGDFSFGGYKNNENIEKIKEFRERVNVKQLYLILGNHDAPIRKSEELKSLFSGVFDYLEVDVVVPSEKQGVKAHKQHIIMCHYAFRTWNRQRKGSWNLFGHSHNNLEGVGKQIDVGFDTREDFKPYSFKEIDEIMSKKELIVTEKHRE